MSDERLDALAEMRAQPRPQAGPLARPHAGQAALRQGRADRRTAKRCSGWMPRGRSAKPDDVEDFLRNLGARTGAHRSTSRCCREAQGRTEAARRRERPRARSPKPDKPRKPKPPNRSRAEAQDPRRQARRRAAPGRADQLLGHEIDEKGVRKQLGGAEKAGEPPLVATLDKTVVGLVGIHRWSPSTATQPVGRIPSSSSRRRRRAGHRADAGRGRRAMVRRSAAAS